MKPLFESLFDEDGVVHAGAVMREELLITIAGARVKFPRSLLSMYRILPRTMSRYPLEPMQTEIVTGVVFTTTFNVRRNLGLAQTDALTMQAIDSYYLDKSNEVISLMIANTDMANVTTYRARNRRIANPVIFRVGSAPLVLVLSSRKKLTVYREDTSKASEDNTYTKIAANTAVAARYAGLWLLDVHTPGTALTMTSVYGLDSSGELRKLATNTDIANYQATPLTTPMRLDDFRGVFDGVKRSIALTNLDMLNE
uniref:Core protein VP8 n=1 Tax=Rousettus bat poxvirus TaxID=3141933 RepID=A0AAU7E2D0_9POXV